MKIALVTGGSKGIGLAIANTLLSQGYKVAVTASTQSSLDQAKHHLSSYGSNILFKLVDVRDYQGQFLLVQEIVNVWGQLDILIANAGVGHFESIDLLSQQQWNEVIDINLTGVFNSVKASIEEIKKTKGYIITIASLAGANFFAKGAAYNASKFGLVGFSQAIMLDLRAFGVKVSTIMPGSVSTNFNGRTPSELDAWKIQPEDIAQIVSDLLKMPARTLPSKVEVRPSIPSSVHKK